MITDKIQSKAIDLCRLPLALGVIFIHLNMKEKECAINWDNFASKDIYRLVECLVTNELASIAVPLFFMISGYLYFYKPAQFNTQVYKEKSRKRFFSLVIPYIIFNILTLAGLLFKFVQRNGDISKDFGLLLGDWKWITSFWSVHNFGPSINIIGMDMSTGTPIDVPLWFVRDLIVLSILAPLIYWIVKQRGLLIIAICYILNIWLPYPGFLIIGWMFFCAGAYFSINRKNMADELYKYKVPLYIATVMLIVVDFMVDGRSYKYITHNLMLMSAVPATLNLASACAKRIKRDLPKWIGQCSFFVFAIHAIPIPYLQRPTEFCKGHIWGDGDNGIICTLQFLGTGLAVMLICMAIYFLFRLICPGVLNFMTGKRKPVARQA